MDESDFKFVGIDSETTGLDDQRDEVLEVTAIEFNEQGQTGRIITKLCKPMASYISAEVTAINHITYDMVSNCPNYLTGGIREEVAKFIGNRTVVGHNIIDFDLKFLKIKVKRAIDTLLICRKKYPGGNRLKSACLRLNIKWDDSFSHRSEYDVKKCIELYCKILAIEEKERAKLEAPLFAVPAEASKVYTTDAGTIKEIVDIDDMKLGIIPNKADKDLFATQTYSYSRLNLFNQCPFKWYMQYIKNLREPDKDYLVTGKICHKVAEWAGEWCYKELFKNKIEVFAVLKGIKLDNQTIKDLAVKYSKKEETITMRDFATYIGQNPIVISTYFPNIKNIGELIYEADQVIPENSYEKPSMPDLTIYNDLIEKAINFYKCSDVDVINDAKKIMTRFYTLKDFALTPGDLTLTEKRLVFDRSWNSLNDFFAPNAFFRGIVDVISYFGEYVIITDYKSSRKMMTLDQIKEDRQTMVYVLLTYMFLPKGSFKRMIVRIEYVRYGETLEYEISNPKEVVDRALAWIGDSIQSVEKEMLKTDGTAFAPRRNEYCHTCFLGEDGMCPLFNKKISGKLDDPFACSVSTTDECKMAWKRIEVNKAEITRLVKLCKSFTEQSQNQIKIDTNATLDFYISNQREYDVTKTLEFLLGKKKLDLRNIIKYFNISTAEMTKLVEDEKLVLTTEELNLISTIKRKTTFDAFTPEEAKSKNVINS